MASSSNSNGAKSYQPPANTSLSALVSSEHPRGASGSPESPSTPPKRPPPSPLKLVALGASVAACVVLGLFLRHQGGGAVERSVLHGSPGIKHTKSGAEVRWRKPQSKVTIDASVEKLGPEAVRSVQSAFGAWLGSDSKLPDLAFDTSRGARLELEPDGKNTVLVAPITLRGHEHDLAITLTFSNEDTGAIVESDIIINSEHAFRVLGVDEGDVREAGEGPDRRRRSSCSDGGAGGARCTGGSYDLQNVVTHEVGHFFGLGEEMTDDGATMFYCTSRCETHKRALTVVDTNSISTLYLAAGEDPATDADTPGGCGGATLVRRGNTGEAALAVATALLLALRRRRTPGQPQRVDSR